MELISCFSLYIRSFSSYVTKGDTPAAMAFSGLVQAHSYRLSSSAPKDVLIGLRYLKKALGLIWSGRENVVDSHENSGKGVFDGNLGSVPERKAYLETITGLKMRIFLSKEELGMELPWLERIGESLIILTLSLVIVPVCFFHPKRGSIALNLLELVECARLMQWLDRSSIKYLYYFCAFNKDSNFVALRLKEKGITSHKVPSSNPIKNFYQRVLADEFSFTAPFQRKEYVDLQKDWKVARFTDWPVFRFQTIQPLLKSYSIPPPNTLGFISSGIWRRIERGDLALGVGELEAELMLIDFLKGYLKRNPQITFSLFLHPVEKNSPELFERAKEHYRKEFEGIELTFYPPEKPSFELFDQVETSIAAYSSTNLERLYAGFKTLYAPLGIASDYYAGSSIENIAAFDEDQLETLLNRCLPMPVSDFFSKHELDNYHNEAYQHLFNRSSESLTGS